MGLELQLSKTRIAHTLHRIDGQRGFDFLGFRVRQFPVGKTHSARLGGPNWATRLLGFKTIITPSKEALRRHLQSIDDIIAAHQMAPRSALIARLNPPQGVEQLLLHRVLERCLRQAEPPEYLELRSWARFRHPHNPRYWIAKKYWRPERGAWGFAAKDGVRLLQHDRTPI